MKTTDNRHVFITLKVSKRDLAFLEKHKKAFDYPDEVGESLNNAKGYYNQRFLRIKGGDITSGTCRFCKRPIVWIGKRPHDLVLPDQAQPGVTALSFSLHSCEEYRVQRDTIPAENWDDLKSSLEERA